MRQAIGDRSGEATTLHNLASIDVEEGDYASAREGFGKSLAIKQAIGDRSGEAATWHNLASIDLREGSYASAREGFGRALAMRQAIGDRSGEAATFSQLGGVAHAMGRGHFGARLLALCWLIDQAIGHGHTESDFRMLNVFCTQLGYDQARFEAMVAEVVQEYQRDRGRSLIERAFAEENESGAEPG